jgi:tRNA-2-methylthio-N6-dimethylallyladenosine synthase
VILSKEETYAEISPVRLGGNGMTAFVSIMRGCDNMCSFCVVPFTRGRERSRDPKTIIQECQQLIKDGYKEVTLLGQNVDSYLWSGGGLKKDFDKLSKKDQKKSVNFAQLLHLVSQVSTSLRVRFSTSHPKDMNDDVLHVMAKHENICKHVHLPVQSGNSRILELMNRGYSRKWYLNRINSIRKIIPGCSISMDIISGFCSETEEDHQDTLSLMKEVKYDFGFMFSYSERPNTQAQRKLEDNVSVEVKKRRLQEIIDLQLMHSKERTETHLHKTHKVLVEGISKKSADNLYGRTTHNTVVVFPKENYKIGDYVMIAVDSCTSATLKGKAINLA